MESIATGSNTDHDSEILDTKEEFESAVERFENVMNEIETLGVRMRDANTKEELYDFLIGRFESTVTENIEFEMEITDNDSNGPGKFVPAVAGTRNNPSGSKGRFGVRAYLWPKGKKEERKRTSALGEIFPTIYNTPSWEIDGSEKNNEYDNQREDAISFYKNGNLVSAPCTIYYNNYRKGVHTKVQYNSIYMEDFNGISPNLIYDYTVLEKGGYSGTYTEVFIYVNGKRTLVIGGPGSRTIIHFEDEKLKIPVPSHEFNDGDYIEIYIDGFGESSVTSGNSSGGSSSGGSGGGGGGSSSSSGSAQNGMIITKKSATSGSWEQADGKWKLKLNDGSYASSQWAMLDGKWYMFDENGNMATGWKKANGKWYLLSQNGDMVTGWQLFDGKWYWLEPSGEMVTGWKWVGDKCYYLDSTGAMASNTTTPDGYSVNENGEWIK